MKSRTPVVLLVVGLIVASAGVAGPILVVANTFATIADPARSADAKQHSIDDGIAARSLAPIAILLGLVLAAVGATLLIARRKRSTKTDNEPAA